MKTNTFRELEAYKHRKTVIKEVYRLLERFPREEQMGNTLVTEYLQ